MIEIKFHFATVAEATAFMATFPRFDSATDKAGPVTLDKPKATRGPKSAETAAPADTKPSAPEIAAPAAPKIEYAPLGEKIAALVAAGKAAKVKAVFATLANKDGSTGVKKGSEVHDDALQALADGLAAIEKADEESMS